MLKKFPSSSFGQKDLWRKTSFKSFYQSLQLVMTSRNIYNNWFKRFFRMFLVFASSTECNNRFPSGIHWVGLINSVHNVHIHTTVLTVDQDISKWEVQQRNLCTLNHTGKKNKLLQLVSRSLDNMWQLTRHKLAEYFLVKSIETQIHYTL